MTDAGFTPEKADEHAELQLEIARRAKPRTITLPEGTWEDMADELYGQGNDLAINALRTMDPEHKERILQMVRVLHSMADALRDPEEESEEKS